MKLLDLKETLEQSRKHLNCMTCPLSNYACGYGEDECWWRRMKTFLDPYDTWEDLAEEHFNPDPGK